MKCKKCGRRIPHGDKYCVYCGSTTGFLPLRFVHGWIGRFPVWVRLTGAATSIFIIGFLITFLLLSKHTPLTPTPTPQPTPTLSYSQTSTAFQLVESVNLPIIAPTVNSKYTTSIPTIDGVMMPSEWSEPAFNKTIQYKVGYVSGTGEMVGYFINDDDNLYVAITVSAEDFNESDFEKSGEFFSMKLYFDGNNDGFIVPREDLKHIGALLSDPSVPYRDRYDDLYIASDFLELWDEQGNGERNGDGDMIFSESTRTYTYEFQIPLNSGDPSDIAVRAGDTIGIKVVMAGYCRQGTSLLWTGLGETGWPCASGKREGTTYSKLVLAKKPSS